jgi:hypothetical protein
MSVIRRREEKAVEAMREANGEPTTALGALHERIRRKLNRR